MITAITSARICACCKRELPSENFYFNHRTQIFDKYCKECRKSEAGSTEKNVGILKKTERYLLLQR